MEKYTVSYGNIKANFVVQNLCGHDVVGKHYSLFCVLKNILMRGTTTPPSKYLTSKLGLLDGMLRQSPVGLQ